MLGFVIQSEKLEKKEFEQFLKSNLSIPLSVIQEYVDGPQIVISKHYFANFADRCMSKYGASADDIIHKIKNSDRDFLDQIECELGITVFTYNILN